LKYYPRPTGSIIEQSCRGGSWSTPESGSPIDPGASISPALGDGVQCSPIGEDGPPMEAGEGTIWGEGDATMSVEAVCVPVCGVEEDEDGICQGGTERGLGAIVRVCNPVGGGWEDEDGIELSG